MIFDEHADGKIRFHVSVVIEECTELIQGLLMADRSGWFNGSPRTNMEVVKYEMDDVVKALAKLEVILRTMKHEHNQQERVGGIEP